MSTWPKCGHPRTLENSQRIGRAGIRCRECRRRITRESAARKAAKARENKPPKMTRMERLELAHQVTLELRAVRNAMLDAAA